MRQLDEALHVLFNQGIQVASWKAINGGNNSRIFRLISNQNHSFALKFYKPATSADERNRLQAEQDFLNYLETTEASKQTPKLVYSNPHQNWSLFSWLKGQPLKELGQEQLKQITEFIVKANPRSSRPDVYLKSASEACLSHESICENLKKRLHQLTTVEPETDIAAEANDWIRQILEPDIRQQLARFEHQRDSSAWQHQSIRLIASPSDAGIHNTLALNGKLYFLDFEYSGLDDLAKLACDWTLQPHQPLNPQLEDFFLEDLKLKTQHISLEWVDRYKDLKPILRLKWCLIMLNKHLKNKLDLAQFNKVICYHSHSRSLKTEKTA